MATYLNKLNGLLDHACQEGVLQPAVADQLRQMAADDEQSRGILSLSSVIGWLGGGVLGLGIILVISANWAYFPDFAKLSGFLILYGTVQTAAVKLHARGTMPYFTEGIHFLGGILCLGGIGLISQIYQLDGEASTAMLLWFVAIAPLAWAFRSKSITLLSLIALVAWTHMMQAEFRMVSFSVILLTEISLGIALFGAACRLRDLEPQIASVFRAVGVLLLFVNTYFLGFFRHFRPARAGFRNVVSFSDFDLIMLQSIQIVALALAILGLISLWRYALPHQKYLRRRLVLLLSCLLATSAAMVLVQFEAIPTGPQMRYFNFGGYRTYDLADWILSASAWILWFAISLWCIFFASRSGRKNYLNVGVLAFALGVITRFLDLFGSMLETGIAFIYGGLLLLATCWIAEYWRRSILRTLKNADQVGDMS